MVSPLKYIEKVNNAVKNKRHDRPIVVIKTRHLPEYKNYSSKGIVYHWKNKDEIRIPKGMPKTREEADRLAKTEKGRWIKRALKVRKMPTENEVLKHELYHIIKPKATEAQVLRASRNPIPNRLPPRRTSGFERR